MVCTAKALHVTGGRVFGCDNTWVPSNAPSADGRIKRAYVVRRINSSESASVTSILELS